MSKRQHIGKTSNTAPSTSVHKALHSHPITTHGVSDSDAVRTPEDIDNQQYQQDRFEATKLALQAQYGTITPAQQERLGLLQAKKADFWQRHLEHTEKLGYSFANIPVTTRPPQISPQPTIQAKLTIGASGDTYEQEADRVAAQVVNHINAPIAQQPTQTLQREAMSEEGELQLRSETDTIQGEELPDDEELQMKPMMQRQTSDGGIAAAPDLEASINQAQGNGQPLADNIREPMERAFGAEFSGVKVHTDAQSDKLNQSIQARAFTTGQHVFFRQGQYSPGHRRGQELIAHELTHVVQQGRVTRNPELRNEISYQPMQVIRRYTEIAQGHAKYPIKKVTKDPAHPSLGSREPSEREKEEFFVSGAGLSEAGEPVYHYHSDVPLKISDNRDMAIENFAQAKVFFAKKELVDSANEKLKGKVKLQSTNKYLLVTSNWWSHKLHQVEPVVPKDDREGLGVRTPQRCNEMAQFVSGKVALAGEATLQAHEILVQVLQGTREEQHARNYKLALVNWHRTVGTKEVVDEALDEMVRGYLALIQDAVQAQEIERKLKKKNINKFMRPQVGEPIVAIGLYERTDDPLKRPVALYHFGTVVAKSGGDYITMENYSRGEGQKTASGGDPLFFFRMFGTKKPVQSWHSQVTERLFTGAVFSFVVK